MSFLCVLFPMRIFAIQRFLIRVFQQCNDTTSLEVLIQFPFMSLCFINDLNSNESQFKILTCL